MSKPLEHLYTHVVKSAMENTNHHDPLVANASTAVMGAVGGVTVAALVGVTAPISLPVIAGGAGIALLGRAIDRMTTKK